VQRRVLYVAAEGAFGFKARVDAWEQGWHTTIGDDQLEILPRPVNLTDAAHVAESAWCQQAQPSSRPRSRRSGHDRLLKNDV
jgi:hypothetical protein